MSNKIVVVGIGPGAKEYVVPRALEAIREAEVLVGGRRALADFLQVGQESFAIAADIAGVLDFIEEGMHNKKVAVLVSGDPGYYSLLDALRRRFSSDQLEVIAGISSVQFAFMRLALPWHGAKLLSMHGRMPKEEDLQYEEGAVLGILTDQVHNSRSISELLLQHGWHKEAKLYICEHLSYPDERIISTNLGEAIALPAISHCVLVVVA